MAYSVKKLADLSGISVRTLHFYDDIGLLKPAYLGANGYRYYEEPQLLALQQILFYRELGFDLKQIKQVLGQGDFDKITALESHRKQLQQGLARTRKLIVTIDRTIAHLKGKKKMKSSEMFVGFDPKQQAKYEQELIDRYGDAMKERIAASKKKVKDWTKADWEKTGWAFMKICQELSAAIGRQSSVDSAEVQALIRQHCHWLKNFWNPNRQSYIGHSQMIVDSDLRKAYEAHDPRLPEFMAAAMKIFAERELS